MSKINLLDPTEIDRWLESWAQAKDPSRAEETARLLSIALKRHFLSSEKTASLLFSPPASAPEWAVNKWDVAGPFHHFAPENDPGLQEKMNHITDWIVSAQENDAPFLKDLDAKSGKPKLLLHIKSVDDACAQAEKYFADRRKKFGKAAEKRPDDGSLHVMDLEDGMHIVEVATKEARQREGALMQHCVGDGAYEGNIAAGKTKIYSLRDRDNQPHATFEVGVEGNSLKQCKGKQNKPPAEKYMPYVEAFVRKNKFTLEEAARYTHLLQGDDGEIYSIFSLPKGFTAKGYINLTGCTALAALPEGFSAGGNVYLNGCTALAALPEGFSAGGNVYLNGCTALAALPEKCPSRTLVVMPGGTEVKPKDWAKARAKWMKERARENSRARKAKPLKL